MGLRFVTLFGIVASIVTGIALGILGYRGWFDGVASSRQADIIEQAARYIRTNYVDDIEDGQLVTDALRGMLDGLDDYSKYLDRDAYERLQADTAGRFGGIGIELGLRGGYFTVIESLEMRRACGCVCGRTVDRCTAILIRSWDVSNDTDRAGPRQPCRPLGSRSNLP